MASSRFTKLLTYLDSALFYIIPKLRVCTASSGITKIFQLIQHSCHSIPVRYKQEYYKRYNQQKEFDYCIFNQH